MKKIFTSLMAFALICTQMSAQWKSLVFGAMGDTPAHTTYVYSDSGGDFVYPNHAPVVGIMIDDNQSFASHVANDSTIVDVTVEFCNMRGQIMDPLFARFKRSPEHPSVAVCFNQDLSRQIIKHINYVGDLILTFEKSDGDIVQIFVRKKQ